VFLGFNHAPYPNGTVLASQYFWDLLHVQCTYSMTNSNQILHGNQIILEDNFTGLTMPPALANNFFNTNADTQSVCVS